jgi:hypothetical protein
VQIPRVILEQHQLVTLAVDVIFVNGVPFLVSVARGLNLVTTKFTPSRTAKQLAADITRMMDLYVCGGFQVGTVLMENEFEKLRNLVPILVVNTTAAKEHVLEVERKIRLIKERGRGILNTLPFKRMPKLMLIELIYHVVLWLNAFLAKECLRHYPHVRLYTGKSWTLRSTVSRPLGRTVRFMTNQRRRTPW